MGIAGSLVQYYLPPDSEVTANIIPSIPFAFVVISLVVNIIRSGRVNEEEGVGGALDRAITPNGGSRLAASTDSENLYPKLNFFVPDRAVRGHLPAAPDLQAVLVGADGHRRLPRHHLHLVHAGDR